MSNDSKISGKHAVLSSLLRAWIVSVCFLSLVPLHEKISPPGPADLEIIMRTDTAGEIAVFRDTGTGFNDQEYDVAALEPSDDFQAVRIPLGRKTFHHLRFDPLDGPGGVQIRDMRIVDERGHILHTIEVEQVSETHQIERITREGNTFFLVFSEGATDPQVVLSFPRSFSPDDTRVLWNGGIFSLTLLAMVLFMIVASRLVVAGLPALAAHTIVNRVFEKALPPLGLLIIMVIPNLSVGVVHHILNMLRILTALGLLGMFVEKLPSWFSVHDGEAVNVEVRPSGRKPVAIVLRIVIVPLLFYFLLFHFFTYPLLDDFSTYFFTDDGDGLQFPWNLWWFNKAVTELGVWPWQTDYLFAPHGVSLLAHSYSPFNGIVAIVLLRWLSLTQTFNAVLVLSFVLSGYFLFLLCHRMTGTYWPAILAGSVFTFANYHFAHAEGHLHLVSMQFMPLFILAFDAMLQRPGVSRAVWAAGVLFLVFLCDHYYFLYCVMIGLIMVVWEGRRRKSLFFCFTRDCLLSFAVFSFLVLVSAGPFIFRLLQLSHTDPLEGAHAPEEFSMDLCAPIIPGGHWKWAELTRWFWSDLPGNIHESSVHLGLAVVLAILFVIGQRARLRQWNVNFWLFLLFFFGILSLGPRLQVMGQQISWLKMPYALFEFLFPPLALSGCPARMNAVVILSAGMLCAFALHLFLTLWPRRTWLVVVLLLLMTVEFYPRPIPRTRLEPPLFIQTLKEQPEAGIFCDGLFDEYPFWALYYQTIHEKPMSFGFVSRTPASIEEHLIVLRLRLNENNYRALVRDEQVTFLLQRKSSLPLPVPDAAAVLYEDDAVILLNLQPTGTEADPSVSP